MSWCSSQKLKKQRRRSYLRELNLYFAFLPGRKDLYGNQEGESKRLYRPAFIEEDIVCLELLNNKTETSKEEKQWLKSK